MAISKNKKQKYEFKTFNKMLGDEASDIMDFINEGVKMHSYKEKITIKSIISNPHQPRKSFNQVQLNELAESIKEHGLIQPIVVTKIDKNNYQLVAGQRRLEAFKLADLEFIDAIIVKLSDKEIEEIALIENIQRVDLTPIEEAIAYHQLAKTLNITQDEIAKKIKKSRSYVANVMRLLNLPNNIKNDLLNNKITSGQVRPLLTISDKDLIQDYYKKIIKKNLTAREVENLVKFKELKSSTKKNINKSNTITHLENELSQKLGTRVNIEKRKIVINYTNVADLNRILEILKLIN